MDSRPESPTCWGVWRGDPQQVGDSNTVTLRNPKEPLSSTEGGEKGNF